MTKGRIANDNFIQKFSKLFHGSRKMAHYLRPITYYMYAVLIDSTLFLLLKMMKHHTLLVITQTNQASISYTLSLVTTTSHD